MCSGDQVDDSERVNADKIGCAHSSRVFKVRMYHDTLMNTAQKLADVTQITLRMEMSGQETSENIQFASILHKCGSELADIGQFLQEKAKEITDEWAKHVQKQVKSTLAPKTKCKHEHFYEIPIAAPCQSEEVIDEEISVIPKPASDLDINMYHDPKRSKPMWTKEEVPSCSSASEQEDIDAAENSVQYPMGLVKPFQRRSKTNVKGLFACEICRQDYTSRSDLANHTAQHAGITYTCDKCEKNFHSRKSFENHAHVHRDGLYQCNQCGKTFEYPGSLSNHVKKHSNKTYVCKHEGCDKESRSYAMHHEHLQFGHTEKPMIQCSYCDRFFQMPTQMYAHHNKTHGPATHNA